LTTLFTSVAAAALFTVVVALPPSGLQQALLGVCFWAPLALGVAALFITVLRALRTRARVGLISLLAGLGAAGACTLLMFGHIVLMGLLGDSPDAFGRDIVIPKDLRMRLPAEHRFSVSADPGTASSDPDGTRLRASCDSASLAAASGAVSVELGALDDLTGERAEAFMAQLARSPAWHVAEENGRRYAARRFLSAADTWETTLNDYYAFGAGRCQLRVVIGLDGPALADPWTRSGDATVTASAVSDVKLKTTRRTGGNGWSSYLVVQAKQVAVEIFDEAKSEDRAVTRAALQLVDNELRAFVSGSASQRNAPRSQAPFTLDLAEGMQGGIYTVSSQLNAGEPGYAHLQIYEHTRNTRLSAESVELRSKQIIGWSKRPEERFLYQVEITVYEGDWGVYYPARFELWFVPDSGAPARKLVQDIFRIEGWQR
jgi:hypothetical protein